MFSATGFFLSRNWIRYSTSDPCLTAWLVKCHFCIENQGQNLHKSPWLWSSILQTFEGIYAYNINKKNRIRFPLDFVALFGQVSIWKSYFERCPIARHKWYLFTLAKIDMAKYCYVQMLKKCHRLFETNCPLNSLCALATIHYPLGFKTLPILGHLQNLLLPLYFWCNNIPEQNSKSL